MRPISSARSTIYFATSGFDAKYAYNFWRPITAIRNADLDDNSRTALDTGWFPFLTTPPHPEYPAAHGIIQTAGARVLEKYFGQHYGFDTTSATVPGVTRHYGGSQVRQSHLRRQTIAARRPPRGYAPA